MLSRRLYSEDEIFYYMGSGYPLKVTDSAIASEVFSFDGSGRAFVIDRANLQRGFELFVYWYGARTGEILRSLLPLWSKRLSLRPRSASVKYAKTRWGSCTSKGDLMFNCRLAMLSLPVAEYVVVHELCHLLEMNHKEAFWKNVEKALPSWKALRKKLREEEKNAIL